jgi:hypothetical protein
MRTGTTFALFVCSAAFAQPVYQINLRFDDGGTASGYWDASRSAMTVSTTAGTTRGPATYTLLCAWGGQARCQNAGGTQRDTFTAVTVKTPATGTPMLFLSLGTGAVPLKDQASPSKVVGYEASCAFSSCDYPDNPFRAIVSGSAVLVTLDTYQVRHFTLDSGDGIINITNAGTLDGTDKTGSICVNVYAFAPTEEIVSCCACRVTPNGLVSLSLKNDIMNNTLYAAFVQNSVTVALFATAAGSGACNAATQPTPTNLARGMKAWATTLHTLSVQGSQPFRGHSETPFAPAEFSVTEYQKLTSYCNFIQLIYSGRGQCKSCSTVIGAQGGVPY